MSQRNIIYFIVIIGIIVNIKPISSITCYSCSSVYDKTDIDCANDAVTKNLTIECSLQCMTIVYRKGSTSFGFLQGVERGCQSVENVCESITPFVTSRTEAICCDTDLCNSVSYLIDSFQILSIHYLTMKLTICIILVIISSIQEVSHSINIPEKKFLGVKKNERYYLYPMVKCLENTKYSIRIVSPTGSWCTNNLLSARMHSIDNLLSSINCSFQYNKMVDDVDIVGECKSSRLTDIVGVIDSKFMNPVHRYPHKRSIIKRPKLRDLIIDIITQKEQEELEKAKMNIMDICREIKDIL
ncbi:hypothetical protein SNEBB_003398 [Seison nebaliae]|nr:hypothetical protein SNEBB_003398 [Seison nebaliae]